MNISSKNKQPLKHSMTLMNLKNIILGGKKPDADDQILYDSICIKCTEKSNVKRLYILMIAGAEGQ